MNIWEDSNNAEVSKALNNMMDDDIVLGATGYGFKVTDTTINEQNVTIKLKGGLHLIWEDYIKMWKFNNKYIVGIDPYEGDNKGDS